MSMPTPSTKRNNFKSLSSKELIIFMNHHGISAQELAEILGVSLQAVNLWINGKRELSITNSRLLRLLDKYPKLIGEF